MTTPRLKTVHIQLTLDVDQSYIALVIPKEEKGLWVGAARSRPCKLEEWVRDTLNRAAIVDYSD
jgi:hypothetical protein